jgi:hypothetical protein
MADIKLKAGSPQTLEASGGSASAGDWAIANDADLNNTVVLALSYDFELNCAFGGSVAAGDSIDLILVPKLDGTNLGDIATASDAYQYGNLAGTFVNATASGASRRLQIEGVDVGPYKYTAYLFNRTSQTLSATWALIAYPVLNQSV